MVPVIHRWLWMNPGLILPQDGAPGHSGKETQVDLNERRIYPVFRPAISPDLNPIETGMRSGEEIISKGVIQKVIPRMIRLAAW
jgi:hypothetical protein